MDNETARLIAELRGELSAIRSELSGSSWRVLSAPGASGTAEYRTIPGGCIAVRTSLRWTVAPLQAVLVGVSADCRPSFDQLSNVAGSDVVFDINGRILISNPGVAYSAHFILPAGAQQYY